MEFDYIEMGDCLELMNNIPDGSIDMILCDLPYGTTRNKWDSIVPLPELWAAYKRIAKKNAAVCLFSQPPFDKALGISNISKLRYEWIWVKDNGTGFLNANRMPLKKTENILVFYDTLPVYHPQMTEGKPYKNKQGSGSENWNYNRDQGGHITENNGTRYPVNVLNFNRDQQGYHTTQKPVALLEYLIRTYTDPGAVVLDNCMGSGSTCVACVNTDRHYIGFEREAKYFEIACQRLDEAESG